MIDSLISDSRGRPADDPIFAINSAARARSAAGEQVINASLGALLDDDGALAILPTVFETFRAVDPRAAAAYAPIAGDAPFLAAVIRDTFGDSALADTAVAAATPGGTGALLNAMMNFLEPGQALYTSSYYWSPYRIIAGHNRRGIRTFPMFRADGAFDVEAFECGLVDLVKEQGRALVVLNFPCHNPTGYTLDSDEWERTADALARAAAEGPVALLVDLAYCHFGTQPNAVWTGALERIADRVTILAAWTASKSFAQYGARVGALVASVPDEAARRDIENALSYTCRGTWSNCNHLGILAIGAILGDAELSRRVDEERAELTRTLAERVERFNVEAAAAGLRYPRYEGGFFVSVFTPDAKETARVAAEAGVYVVPMDGAVRIALCAVASRDVPKLVAEVARGVAAAQSTPTPACRPQ